jgi:hypothetical protein
MTFGDFMPRVATFFNIGNVFLTTEEGHVLLKYLNIWETLSPFKYSKIKVKLSRLHLIRTGNMTNLDFIMQDKNLEEIKKEHKGWCC